jgi:hypothetical protein
MTSTSRRHVAQSYAALHVRRHVEVLEDVAQDAPPCARTAGMLFMTAQVVRYAFEAWESHGDSMIIRSSASLTVGSNISSARGSSSDHRSVAPALFTAGCLLASLTWNAVAALNAIWPVGKCATTRESS